VDRAAASTPDESRLIAQARTGDRLAQDLLVRRHLRDVHDLCCRVLGDGDLAQDATQNAFVSALRAIDRFRGDASFKTWILRIALNSARSIGRRRGRRREVPLSIVADHADADASDPAERAVVADEAARVTALLERLPPKQKLAVSLRVNQGLSYQEIGRIIDCSEGAARVNYHLGVKRLRELLG
jgi:RNA polymerase sigma-70 factor (ECF subfamily)